MSVTVTRIRNGEDVWGKHHVRFVDIVGDTSYPTGGYTISPAKVGMKTIRGFQRMGGNAASAVVNASWDTANGKLILSYPTGGATAPATLVAPTNAAGAVVTIAAGAVAVTSSAANGAIGTVAAPANVAGIGKEVANTTDVSSITIRGIFIGD